MYNSKLVYLYRSPHEDWAMPKAKVIQTNKQTNPHTYIHTYMHAYIHTYILAFIPKAKAKAQAKVNPNTKLPPPGRQQLEQQVLDAYS